MKRREWWAVLPFGELFDFESSAEICKERQEIYGANPETVRVVELKPGDRVLSAEQWKVIKDALEMFESAAYEELEFIISSAAIKTMNEIEDDIPSETSPKPSV